MDMLMTITKTESGNNAVSARDLHEFLEVSSRFNDWIKNRIEKYDFIEDDDYVTITKSLVTGGNYNEYIISLDMAKELSMVENNDKGKQARRYFIEVEKKSRELYEVPRTYSESLRIAYEQAKYIEDNADKVIAANTLMAVENDGNISITETFKHFNIKPRAEGFPYLRENGYLTRKDIPTAKSLQQDLMVVKQIIANDGTTVTTARVQRNQLTRWNKLIIPSIRQMYGYTMEIYEQEPEPSLMD